MKVRIVKNLWRSKTAQNIAVLVAGTAGAQALAILVSPIITRLYGPEVYGVFGVFSSLLMILTSIGAMSYPMALVLPKEHYEAVHVTRVSAGIALSVATILTVVWLFSPDILKKLPGIHESGDYLGFLPLALLAGTWSQVASLWLTRLGDFKSISKITLLNAVWMNIARVFVGLTWPAAAGLIWIYILGQIALAMQMTKAVCNRTPLHEEASHATGTAPTQLSYIFWKYRDFPLYRAPQDFINAVSRGIPVIALSSMSGPASAGLYMLATQLMGIPSTLVGNAITNVLYPDMARRSHDGRSLTVVIVRATSILALIGLVPFGTIFLFGPWLFSMAFGENWRDAGAYSQWLALFYYVNFINKPAVTAIPMLGVQKGLLIYEIVATTAKLSGLYVGYRLLGNELAAIAIFSVAGTLAYAALIGWVIAVSSRKDADDEKAS